MVFTHVLFEVTSVTHIFLITHQVINIPKHFSLWHQIDLDIGKCHTQGQVSGGTTLAIRAVGMTSDLSECNVRHGGIAPLNLKWLIDSIQNARLYINNYVERNDAISAE